jgi:hexulose-6-phosphate isomerase
VWLLGQCKELGINRVVLPFVDNGAITTPGEADQVVASLNAVLPAAERLAIEVHLETALDPHAFRALLERLDHPLVKVNYDSGNSAALGYSSDAEFAAYGNRIGSVHIKDRVRGGGTVPLGSGNADLPAVFSGLKALGYDGDIVLQVARGTAGEEIAWARHNRIFVVNGWME